MGMTNKQFQGFIRLALELLERALQKSPDKKSVKSIELSKIHTLFLIHSVRATDDSVRATHVVISAYTARNVISVYTR